MTVTLSSSFQIRIPIDVIRKNNWKKGQKLFLNTDGDDIIISSPQKAFNKLAGYIKVNTPISDKQLKEQINSSRFS